MTYTKRLKRFSSKHHLTHNNMFCPVCKKPLPEFARALKKQYCSKECEDQDKKNDVPDFMKQFFG